VVPFDKLRPGKSIRPDHSFQSLYILKPTLRIAPSGLTPGVLARDPLIIHSSAKTPYITGRLRMVLMEHIHLERRFRISDESWQGTESILASGS
jgi:hypothetical protein